MAGARLVRRAAGRLGRGSRRPHLWIERPAEKRLRAWENDRRAARDKTLRVETAAG
jgi:hypothetical protein